MYFIFRIPKGTSPELNDLLTGLLRRDAKDRMAFDEFFNHPFINGHSICDKPLSGRSQNQSPTNTLITADKISKDFPKPHTHSRVARLKEVENVEIFKQQQTQQSRVTIQSPISSKQKSINYSRSPNFADDFPNTSVPDTKVKLDSSDNFDDFVMINDDVVSTIVTPTTSSQISNTTSSFPQRLINRTITTIRPLVNAYTMPEPVPVPTQRAAYEQIQRSIGSNSSSIGIIYESDSENGSISNNNSTMITSPPATPPQNFRFRRTGNQVPSPPATLNLKRQDSCSSIGSIESGGSRSSRNMLITDVSQMSPPSLNFVLGSSPTMTTSPGSGVPPNTSSLNRSRRLSVPHCSNPSQISPTFFTW